MSSVPTPASRSGTGRGYRDVKALSLRKLSYGICQALSVPLTKVAVVSFTTHSML